MFNEYLYLIENITNDKKFSKDDYYIKYGFNGSSLYKKEYNEVVLFISNNSNHEVLANKIKLKDIKHFKKIYNILDKNSNYIESWKLSYIDNKIFDISCCLNFDNGKNFYFVFNNDFKLTYISKTINYGEFKSYSFFDKNFKSISTLKSFFKSFKYETMKNEDLYLDDQLFLIKLEMTERDSELHKLFPEYSILSAYNFNDIEFKQRKELSEILEF